MEIQRFGKGCNSRLNPFVIQPNITSMKKTTLDYNAQFTISRKRKALQIRST